jgi:hypothetical protein
MAETIGSFLNFDSGISRVVWDTPFHPGDLPDRRQLPPSEVATVQQLARLLQVDNIDTVIARSLRPAVDSPEVLRPDRFGEALKEAAQAVDAHTAHALGTDKPALEALGKVLHEQAELKAALDYYRDMLIAG